MNSRQKNVVVIAAAANIVAIIVLFWMVFDLKQDVNRNTSNDIANAEYQARVNSANNLSPYR